ncbi:MAG: hypothetical protein A2W91_15530 [Bacteroidetes bacterium GWF2_38_335]|nr:MAG: hypothetical protein A2W91_15530 [Bacteroidetes bacterium GWF2_38_335]OFY81506.1 MAG: hypothetical protein A2281_11390 [Bacteroidetes bacterium RIFOXYA12_FULL_38_20]HBS87673.1 hypothetical protein [Bacteroidales bacterium]
MKYFITGLFLVIFLQINFAQDHKTDAENYIKQIEGKLDKAKASIDAECAGPNGETDPQLWYLKGYIYAEIAKSKVYQGIATEPGVTSLQAIQKCYKLDTDRKYLSDCINVLFEIATMFYDEGIENYNRGLESGNKEFFNTALKGFEKYYQTIETLGEDAIMVLHLLKMNKINVNSIYVYTGYCSQQTENYDKAKEYYLKVIDFNSPVDTARKKALPLAYIYYCNLLEKQGNISEASRVIERGIQVLPENSDMLITALNLYKKAEKVDELTTILQRAALVLPDNYKVLVILGNNLLETAEMFVKRGYMKTALEYNIKASEAFEKAISIDDSDIKLIFMNANALNEIAKTYFANGDEPNSSVYREKSIVYYQKVLAKNPSDKQFLFNTYNNMGAVYYKPGAEIYSGQDKSRIEEYIVLFKKALPYFEKAYSYDPSNKKIINTLRNLYLIFNETAKADEMKKKLEN